MNLGAEENNDGTSYGDGTLRMPSPPTTQAAALYTVFPPSAFQSTSLVYDENTKATQSTAAQGQTAIDTETSSNSAPPPFLVLIYKKFLTHTEVKRAVS